VKEVRKELKELAELKPKKKVKLVELKPKKNLRFFAIFSLNLAF
jgi:DNA-directed RNA polymerase subunit F